MTIRLVVDSRVRLRDYLPASLVAELKQLFTHENSAYKKAAELRERFTKSTPQRVRMMVFAALKNEPKTIETWCEEGGALTFPRGGLWKVRNALEEAGYEVESVDERCNGVRPFFGYRNVDDLELLFPLRDTQRRIVDAFLDEEQGIARAPTAIGKTVAILATIVEAGLPALVVVHRVSLAKQWAKEIQKFLGLKPNEIGMLGNGVEELRPITIAIDKTLARPGVVEKLAPIFGFVAVDEVHLAAANTYVKTIDRFPARFRVGASDLEKRKDRKECLIYDVMGSVVVDIDRQEAIDAGSVIDAEIRLFRTGFSCDWWSRIPEQERSMRWEEMINTVSDSGLRDFKIADVVTREMNAGERVLVFAHRREHCSRLRANVGGLTSVGLMLGGKPDEAEFERTKRGLISGDVRAGFGTYLAIGPSLDVPPVSRGVCATPIHSNAALVRQVRGRISRPAPGKTDAILWYAWDEDLFGLAPVEKLCRVSKRTTILQPDGTVVDARAWLKAEKQRRKERNVA